MNYNIILAYFILSIIVVVKGEFESIQDLPISDLAKKYCSGRRYVDIQFDRENFICHLYDDSDDTGCSHYYINELTITSFHDECFDGQEIEEGIYNGYQIMFNPECDKKIENMVSYSFTDPNEPMYKRSIDISNTVVNSINEVPLNKPIKSLASKYCTSEPVVDIKFNNTDFVCYLNSNFMVYPDCGVEEYIDYRSFITTFTNDCIKGEQLEEGVYSVPATVVNGCDTGFMSEWQYYIVDEYGMLPTPEVATPTETVTPTIPVVTGTPTSVDDLPVSDLAKKYCSGHRNVEIQFDSENFICHMYDSIDTSGCIHRFVNELTMTSLHDECFDGQKIEEGVYNGYQTLFNSECDKKTEKMISYTFTDPIQPAYKRSINYNDNVVSSFDKVPFNESSKDLVEKYCTEHPVTDIKFNDIDFVCNMNYRLMSAPSCGPQKDYRTFISTFTNECLKGEPLEDGIYAIPASNMNGCDTSFMNEWQYYIVDEVGIFPTPIETVTPTETATTETVTLTVPEITTSTIIPTITNCLPVTVTLYEKENVTVTSKETVTITNKETVTVTSKETVTVTGEIAPTMMVDKQCVKRYGQCGGVGYSGPTCCQSGLTCREMSRYYSRCI